MWKQNPDENRPHAPFGTHSANSSVTRHVQAPTTNPNTTPTSLPPGQNICADCERLIVGKKPPANTISAALTSHTTAPKSPVSAPKSPISAPSYQAPPSLPPYSPSPTSFSGPKPFGAPSNTKSTSGTVYSY
uniref:Uncharacterized protein n=1 Tax=Cacopsylla melanoneura TaxID=428564 RepID=A0A8D8UWP0_9HEMI